jgi:hypothetical protein
MTATDDDVLTALLLDPAMSVAEAEQLAAALSGAKLPVDAHEPTEDDLGDE